MRGLRRLLLNNLGLKLLALAISVALWIVYVPEPLEAGYDVPIAFGHAPHDLAVVGNSPNTVHLLIRGRAALIRRISPGDLNFTVDLSQITPGETLVRLTPEMASVPYGTDVVGLAPATMRVSWVPGATSTPR